MDLAPKTLRDAYGIDSFERAIVWSSLVLRAGYILSDNAVIKDAVQLTLQLSGTEVNLVQNIIIRASLLVKNNSLIQGANVLANIEERFFGSLSWLGASSNPSIGDFTPIVPEPPNLSLEGYFYWACQSVIANDISQYRRIQIIPIFKGTANPFTLDTQISLKFDYATFLETNNLVSAVGATETPIVIVPTAFNNQTQLNNTTQLNNG
jgi:hypothetical protein